jgi:hypothetical protein
MLEGLACTLALEVPAAGRSGWLPVLCANLVSYPLAWTIYGLAHCDLQGTWLAVESGVVCLEAGLLSMCAPWPAWRCALYVLLANAASAGLALILHADS